MHALKLGFLLAGLAAPALAQPPPACTQNQAGIVACMAGKLCSCGYVRGGTMTGRAEGWQWDCGILRPACGEALPPAGLDGAPSPQLTPQLDVQVPAPPISPWRR
jgi:hypothetical protein